jgi:hypothetical protein
MRCGPTNFDPGPWKEVSRENGIRIVEVPDFHGFFEFVNRGFGDTDTEHLWRGQRNSLWEIVSSLRRTGKPDWGLLSNFQKSVARCTHVEFKIDGDDDASSEAKLRLWSLGQHHGLCTPLIDWTIYPFVALFFAFAEDDESESERSVFALSWGSVQIANFNIVKKHDSFKARLNSRPYSESFKQELIQNYGGNFRDEHKWMIEKSEIPSDARERLLMWERKRLEDQRLRIYTPRTNENPRIHSQGGRHIYTPNDTSIETWVKASATDPEVKAFGNILTKVVIPNSERTAILQCLNRMNINYLSLFPDFEGAAKHCNLALREQIHSGIREY